MNQVYSGGNVMNAQQQFHHQQQMEQQQQPPQFMPQPTYASQISQGSRPPNQASLKQSSMYIC